MRIRLAVILLLVEFLFWGLWFYGGVRNHLLSTFVLELQNISLAETLVSMIVMIVFSACKVFISVNLNFHIFISAVIALMTIIHPITGLVSSFYILFCSIKLTRNVEDKSDKSGSFFSKIMMFILIGIGIFTFSLHLLWKMSKPSQTLNRNKVLSKIVEPLVDLCGQDSNCRQETQVAATKCFDKSFNSGRFDRVLFANCTGSSPMMVNAMQSLALYPGTKDKLRKIGKNKHIDRGSILLEIGGKIDSAYKLENWKLMEKIARGAITKYSGHKQLNSIAEICWDSLQQSLLKQEKMDQFEQSFKIIHSKILESDSVNERTIKQIYGRALKTAVEQKNKRLFDIVNVRVLEALQSKPSESLRKLKKNSDAVKDNKKFEWKK